MVERRKELNQRYHRKKKMTKLKAKLVAAKDDKAREAVLGKIKMLSPFWTEASLAAAPAAAPKAPKAKATKAKK
jgi:hypothetical protein